jgi:thiamine biosynthesis lipoprotein
MPHAPQPHRLAGRPQPGPHAARPRIGRLVAVLAIATVTATALGGERQPAAVMPPPLVGPAFGTTYRVQLARVPSGRSRAVLARGIEQILATIDREASTWRGDSDASRFNDAPAGVWVPVSAGLVAVVEQSRAIHAATQGAFDITIAPLVAAWGGGPARTPGGAAAGRVPTEAEIARAQARVGMAHVESRGTDHPDGPALRKRIAGVALDLSGIAPGVAVDRIGEHLRALGSDDHLVELGGEVRAWGCRPDGTPWHIMMRPAGSGTAMRSVPLADGEALAVSTRRAGRSPLDPRTGRPPEHGAQQAIVRARLCAVADAWAVACLVRGTAALPHHTGAGAVNATPHPLAIELVPTATP